MRCQLIIPKPIEKAFSHVKVFKLGSETEADEMSMRLS